MQIPHISLENGNRSERLEFRSWSFWVAVELSPDLLGGGGGGLYIKPEESHQSVS